jgi:hypothetical protein
MRAERLPTRSCQPEVHPEISGNQTFQVLQEGEASQGVCMCLGDKGLRVHASRRNSLDVLDEREKSDLWS